jgi:hypothetical protein
MSDLSDPSDLSDRLQPSTFNLQLKIGTLPFSPRKPVVSLFSIWVVGWAIALAAWAGGGTDWGFDRQLVAGRIGQSGIAADRTPGPDSAFLGVLCSSPSADTIKLFRTINRGEDWALIWQAGQIGQQLSNLVLRIGSGQENWVFLFWIADDGANSGDVRAVRVAFDGSTAQYLQPTTPGSPDTLRWLAATRSFDPLYRLYLFWQDEVGLIGPGRNPTIKYSFSTDFGLSWSTPGEVMHGFETPVADYGAPGHIYLAGRSVRRQDIASAMTRDDGQIWTFRWLTNDSTVYNDMFPSVAASHDSAVNEWVCVSYDTYRATWGVRCAYSSNAGGSWVLNRQISSGSGNQFWSSLDCAGNGARRIRAVYVSNTGAGYRVCYRTGLVLNPTNWTPAVIVSDYSASNAMSPVVTSYGVGDDSANQGLVFYAEPGPVNVWYDAYQFAGLAEAGARLRPERFTGITGPEGLQVSFTATSPGAFVLSLYGPDGRLVKELAAGRCPTGNHVLRFRRPELPAGTYFLVLSSPAGSESRKLLIAR